MKTNTLLLAVLLATGSMAAPAQVISYSPRTGDISIDTQLVYFNDYGRRDRIYFVDDVVNNFGAPRYLVNELLENRRWAPGDVYYACALAYQAGRPCSDVVRVYDENRGQGWGVVAQRMGIKPGSAQFHALKGQLGKSKGRFQARPASVDVKVDTGPGNSGKAKAKARAKPASDGPGNSGKGNSGKGTDKAKGKGKGH